MVYGNKIEFGLRKAHKELSVGITVGDEIRIAYKDIACDVKTIELSFTEAQMIADWIGQATNIMTKERLDKIDAHVQKAIRKHDEIFENDEDDIDEDDWEDD